MCCGDETPNARTFTNPRLEREGDLLRLFAYAALPSREHDVAGTYEEMARRLVFTVPHGSKRTRAIELLLESRRHALEALRGS